jgi:hypothetical protein
MTPTKLMVRQAEVDAGYLAVEAARAPSMRSSSRQRRPTRASERMGRARHFAVPCPPRCATVQFTWSEPRSRSSGIAAEAATQLRASEG